jgi:hypothetical protein
MVLLAVGQPAANNRDVVVLLKDQRLCPHG